MNLDDKDREILRLLQQDLSVSIATIADKVALSQTPCWKRIQKLEAYGIIKGRVAILDQKALGLSLTAFVSIEAADHSPAWLERFGAAVSDMPEVMDVYRMAGDIDYVLRVVTADVPAFDAFYQRLITAIPLKNVTSRFAMECLKSQTALPI